MGIGNSDSSSDTYTMLNHLHISNFAIVPELDMDFHAGFTAITGETGAGKSILVDALGLLLGDRSDSGWVRAGAERAELAAEFSVVNNAAAREWLKESELSASENCLLRRTINSNGRSRAFINGSPVTLSQIQTLGNLLVEIHGQNEHLRLTKSSEQFRLLDGSGSYATEIESVQSAYADWKRLTDEMYALDADTPVAAADLEFLRFQLDELQQNDLGADAVVKLQTEHDRLAAGGALLETLTAAIELLEPENVPGVTGVNAGLVHTLGRLQQFIPLDKDISDACQMLQEAAVNCGEAINSLRVARDRVDLNPARYEEVANQLGQLSDLARKHRVRMDSLEDIRDKLAIRIERAGSAQQRRSQLEVELATCLAAYRRAAVHLHDCRIQHAQELSGRVMELMTELGMVGGIFELVVSHNPEGRASLRGDDELHINISANPGLAPGPLNKIASGGELSRISLAIKVAASGGSESVTQIFDEVDAGIGGDTANSVGRLLKRLSFKGQALCVTHLAQVAVCATHQLQVRKESGQVSTLVDTSLLDSENRVDEIARMLSGRISEQSRAHAIELLNAAGD
ncbi:MAG: DNA repair protein RecN [Gammaproteobacteria bacterium]|nr:MAG: DNA repair protein RecN [Gammaproteobacteria bacterium]